MPHTFGWYLIDITWHIYPLGLYIGWWLKIIAGSVTDRHPSILESTKLNTVWQNQKPAEHHLTKSENGQSPPEDSRFFFFFN